MGWSTGAPLHGMIGVTFRTMSSSIKLAALIAVLLVANQAAFPQTPSPTAAAATPAPTSTAPSHQADRVIALLDRRVVTERDFDFFVAEARVFDPSLQSLPVEECRKLIVSEVVDEFLLGGWAEMQLKGLPAEAGVGWATDAVARYEKMIGGSARLNDLLADLDLDRARFRLWLEDTGKRRMLVREAVGLHANTGGTEMPGGSPTEATRMRLAHILIATDPTAWERALQVRRDIQAGLAFDEAARLYSDDAATAPQGGEIGWVAPDDIDPLLWRGAQGLAKDAVGAPIATDRGYHLVQLVDFETPAQAAFLKKVRAEEHKQLLKLREETDVRLAPGYLLLPLEDEEGTPAEPTPTDAPK